MARSHRAKKLRRERRERAEKRREEDTFQRFAMLARHTDTPTGVRRSTRHGSIVGSSKAPKPNPVRVYFDPTVVKGNVRGSS